MDDPGKRAESGRAADSASVGDRLQRSCIQPQHGVREAGPHSSDPSISRILQERDQLRLILQMVLDVRVYDGAGRTLTVQNALRGHLATRVRMVLDARRMEHEPCAE